MVAICKEAVVSKLDLTKIHLDPGVYTTWAAMVAEAQDQGRCKDDPAKVIFDEAHLDSDGRTLVLVYEKPDVKLELRVPPENWGWQQ